MLLSWISKINLFEIGPADTLETTGVCTDSFVASGTSGITTPVICGMNTGQHRK